MSVPTFIRPPLRATTEHMFTPLVWMKPIDGRWVVEVDWAESYQHSHDTALVEDVEGRDVDIDAETASVALDKLLESGALPKGDAVTSLPWVDFDPDPMEYFYA